MHLHFFASCFSTDGASPRRWCRALGLSSTLPAQPGCWAPPHPRGVPPRPGGGRAGAHHEAPARCGGLPLPRGGAGAFGSVAGWSACNWGGGGGSPPKPVGEGSIPPTHPGIQPLVPSSLYPEATCLDVGARRDHPAWHGGLVARPCLWAWPSADKMTFFWPKCCFCGAILG